MSPNVKAKWVAALRSGRYQQGKGALHKDNAYCCLGVLCDIAVEEGVTNDLGPLPGSEGNHVYGLTLGNCNAATTPLEVAFWAEITPRGDLPNGACLSEQNDAGATFAEIADLIDSML